MLDEIEKAHPDVFNILLQVLDDGRIDAIGTHDELLKSCEIYREVYQSQQKGGNDHE